MQIGEMAKRSGFSKDTLRYYEKIGLISFPKKQRAANNYRIYDEALYQQLLQIKNLKSAGFTLNEIKDLLRMQELDLVSCQMVGGIIEPKLAKIRQQILLLQQTQAQLLSLMENCDGDCMKELEAKGVKK